MPFIHIKSLPVKDVFNVSKVLLAITRDFSTHNNIPINHVHTTWEFYQSGYYVKGEDAPSVQPSSNHPVIVDLLTPDFNNIDSIEMMLTTLARSLETHSNTQLSNIFINHRYAHSGMVFDDGKIVKW